MLAVAPTTWTQVVVGLSIFVPVIVTIVLAVFVLRGAKNDPDEQRWRQLKDDERSE
jgi:heme/copper-type cytochrome/quinol oxidase subunit 2